MHPPRRAAAALVVLLAASACARHTPVTATVNPDARPAVSPGTPLPVRTVDRTPLSTARQLVVVVTPDWNATSGILHRFTRDDRFALWLGVGTAGPVVLGRTGLAWADASLARDATQPVKQEGDGRSPAGAFPLDTAFGFAPRTDLPWLRVPYAALQTGSECVDDAASAYYNTVVDRATVARVDWTSAEHMRQIGQYRLGVIVGYNAAPPTPGRGSCIFLHIWGGPSSTTAGCTALDASALETLVRWLDSARRPMLVQLPAAEYERLRTAWMLPAAR